ncbi:four-carbon acid sugar kinase family protein [Ammoniphilus sp. YIM 78166]|uniref:four-carbon acid sugar kinase family protein n=1 Tax=Ammoniphilus sp. YIM 78166 TaxID=1644106 RepID=UPI00142F5031|nr:four-carbon acid sugar kinase family protein [Ammoniphilus sp. YIM 78166]
MKAWPKAIIISDDLTGANDTGVQFAKQGLSTISLLDLSAKDSIPESDIWVVNAETRSMDGESAYEKMKAISKQLPILEVPFVYKKIDSTLRGHIGREVDALMEHGSFDAAVVVPAYPKNGRKTVGGYHMIHQFLVEDSVIASDPTSPVKESYLPDLLSKQSHQSVGHVEIKEIRKGESSLMARILSKVEKGNRILTFDCASELDLNGIADAVCASGLRVLWVGSAGLAQSLSGKMGLKRTEPFMIRERAGKTLVVAGSVCSITREQVSILSEQQGYCVITANPLALVDEEQRELEAIRLVQQILEAIDQQKNPVLTTDISKSTPSHLELASQLGKIAAEVHARSSLKGLVLTGGDIAYRTCHKLEARVLQILGEVEEGIPFAQILGGRAQSLPVVTKSGAFGTPYSLVHAVNKIEGLSAQSYFREER